MSNVRRSTLAVLGASALCVSIVSGCLDRPVVPTEPSTTNVIVDQVKQNTVDKIDLVFMIDNSSSMGDKQAFLASAVPQLVNRLVQPALDADGQPEFKPIDDIHVAVITSSIGGHGSDQCVEGGVNWEPTQDDKAHLLPSVRTGLTSYQGQGFLWWDPLGEFGGESNSQALISAFQAQVAAAGEKGCGYEASLESWYRFLIDPSPPQKVINEGGQVRLEGIDEDLLAQRREFLRPDSLLAIIELTDENDCSIYDGGTNWIVAQSTVQNDKGENVEWRMPRSTTVCDTNPDDPCCRSCISDEPMGPPTGCTPLENDAKCESSYDVTEDDVNSRCWQQKRRFGIDFLQPTRRYVDGLKKPFIRDRDGNEVRNPIYTDLKQLDRPVRDPSLVYFATITGVPWQDIATADSLTGQGLTYKTAGELTNEGRWSWLVPNCRSMGADGVCDQWDSLDPPDDPLMVESQAPRSGTNPATDEPLAPPGSGLDANSINGHEWEVTNHDDLQYACRFELEVPKDCTQPGGCDCGAQSNPEQSPLCQQPDGSYGSSQRYAKGYPGTRHLQVAKDFGANSIIASICPKVSTGDKTSSNYGYTPAVNAIIDRLKEAFPGKCISRPVDIKEDGTVQCNIVEVTARESDGTCAPCDQSPSRTDVNPVLVSPVLKQLKASGQCGPNSPTGIACTAAEYCLCTIAPAANSVACKTEESPDSSVVGWCYVDPTQEPDQSIAEASKELVKDCNPHRMLRFVGADTPKPTSTTFIACQGAPVSSK
jgi:hypothetical protein